MPPTCFHRTAAEFGRAQVARETNAELLALPEGWEACDPAELLAAVASELGSPQEPTRLAALLWLHTLLGCSRQTARPCSAARPVAGAALATPSRCKDQPEAQL